MPTASTRLKLHLMPTPSPLTDKMLAFAAVPCFSYDEAVDWAVDMLVRGYDTPSLLILAGLSKPTNQWEALGYLQAAVRELGLRFDDQEAASLRYARYLVGQVAAGHRAALTELYEQITGASHEALLRDFFLLRWAWEDFDFGETYSDYWPDATPATIEQLAIAKAQQWLEATAPAGEAS